MVTSGSSHDFYSIAFICSQERLEAVQRRPSIEERENIEAYRATYKVALKRYPHGLHYIPFPNEPETVPVWFPPVD